MKPIKKLNGKTVAIVGLGKSWFDYNMSSFEFSMSQLKYITSSAGIFFRRSLSSIILGSE